MIEFHPYGISCPTAGIVIDPVRPVELAVITHAHADHARRGSRHYLAHRLTAPVLRLRLGSRVSVTSVEYGESMSMNGVRLSLHPSGHLPGSAQVRLEHRGDVCVISGDYKLEADGLSTPFEPLKCRHFITESTFGLPVFRFPGAPLVHTAINRWWMRNRDRGLRSLLVGYPLGKAQRLLHHIDPGIGPVFIHQTIERVNRVLRAAGLAIPEVPVVSAIDSDPIPPGSLLIAPHAATGSNWSTALRPFEVAAASGWMLLGATRRRQGGAEGFVLSDHADWDGLNSAVEATRAERVSVVHGYAEPFARWLSERRSIEADAPFARGARAGEADEALR
jgi:putative mRNA 3-end processing factor